MRVSAAPVVFALPTHAPATPYGHDFAANDLTLDEESVCPRCLEWIQPGDIVRRTAFGPAQHEACPRSRGTVGCATR